MTQRLDNFLVERYGISSRTKAQALLSQGLVLVNGKICKPSTQVDEDSDIQILEHEEFVSRGAYKLLGAIKNFNLDLKNKIILDIGSSTGGFTQVALQNGARKVYAVDIGKDQLSPLLLNDKRVVSFQGCDVRKLNKNQVQDVNFVVGDLSFISLTQIIPVVINLFNKNIPTMFLFKPQFECGKEIAKKYKGIIKNKEIHIKLLNEFLEYCKHINFEICNITSSPIKGGDGNIEYLIYFNDQKQNFDIKTLVENAFKK